MHYLDRSLIISYRDVIVKIGQVKFIKNGVANLMYSICCCSCICALDITCSI